MDFAGIGKIGVFVKQKNLAFAANYRVKTGQSIVDGSGRLTLTKSTMFSSIQTSKKNSTSAADKTRLASIKSKLKSGKKLSAAEMNYLKEKDPSTYKKAKYAEEAREELKSELRQAESKQEARQAVMRAMAKIAADCSADLDALQSGAGSSINFGGGDMNFGAGMNFSGSDVSSGVNVVFNGAGNENLNVEGATNISAGEFSNSENVASENFAQANNLQVDGENSDSSFDIMEKYLIAIRAVQDEWLQFTKSDDYKRLPENFMGHIPGVQIFDAILAYKKSSNFRLEE